MKTHIVFLALLMGMLRSIHAAEELQPATLPYRSLFEMTQMDFRDMMDLANPHVSFSVRSLNPEVKLSDIDLYIDSRSGRIPLQISPHGIMVLPVSAQLVQENPRVVSNQPKGSMSIKAILDLGRALPESKTRVDQGMIRYSGLFPPTAPENHPATHDRNESTTPSGPPSRRAHPGVVHLHIEEPAEEAKVTVHARRGDIHLKPSRLGHFVMRYDPDLGDEDPWVRLSPPREWTMERTSDEGAEHPPPGQAPRAAPED